MPKVVYARDDDERNYVKDALEMAKLGAGIASSIQSIESNKLGIEEQKIKMDEFMDPKAVEARDNVRRTELAKSRAELDQAIGTENAVIGDRISSLLQSYKQNEFDAATAGTSFAQQIEEHSGGKFKFVPQEMKAEDGTPIFKGLFQTREGETAEIQYRTADEFYAQVDSLATKSGYMSTDRRNAAGQAMYARSLIKSMDPEELAQFGSNEDEIMRNPKFASLSWSGFNSGENPTKFIDYMRKQARESEKHNMDMAKTEAEIGTEKARQASLYMDVASKKATLAMAKNDYLRAEIDRDIERKKSLGELTDAQIKTFENLTGLAKSHIPYFQPEVEYDPIEKKPIGEKPLPIAKQRRLLVVAQTAQKYADSGVHPADALQRGIMDLIEVDPEFAGLMKGEKKGSEVDGGKKGDADNRGGADNKVGKGIVRNDVTRLKGAERDDAEEDEKIKRGWDYEDYVYPGGIGVHLR